MSSSVPPHPAYQRAAGDLPQSSHTPVAPQNAAPAQVSLQQQQQPLNGPQKKIAPEGTTTDEDDNVDCPALLPLIFPAEVCCPQAYRMMKTLNLDHLFEIRDFLQLSLLMCSIVPLAFGLFFLFDLVGLKCLMRSLGKGCDEPWLKDVPDWLVKSQCIFRLLGSVGFLYASFGALQQLSGYSQGRNLKEKLQERTHDLRAQCDMVLQRAQKQTSTFIQMTYQSLHDDLLRDITSMKLFLEVAQKLDAQQSGKEPLFQRLLIAMAKSLRDVRYPAQQHLSKLYILCSGGGSNSDVIRQTFMQLTKGNMVELLWPNLPNAEMNGLCQKVHPPSQDGPQTKSKGRVCWCPCFGSASPKDTIMASVVSLPTSQALQQMVSSMPKKDDADKVLLPVFVIVNFLSLFTTKAEHASVGRLSEVRATSHITPTTIKLAVGLLAAVSFLSANTYLSYAALKLLVDGDCDSWTTCFSEFLIAGFKALCLLLYSVSVIYVCCRIRVVDDIFAEREQLAALDVFKQHIDELNAHSLSSVDEEGKMFKEIQENTKELSDLISDCMIKNQKDPSRQPANLKEFAVGLEKCHSKVADGERKSKSTSSRAKASRNHSNYQPLHPDDHDDSREEAHGFCSIWSRNSGKSSREISRKAASRQLDPPGSALHLNGGSQPHSQLQPSGLAWRGDGRLWQRAEDWMHHPSIPWHHSNNASLSDGGLQAHSQWQASGFPHLGHPHWNLHQAHLDAISHSPYSDTTGHQAAHLPFLHSSVL